MSSYKFASGRVKPVSNALNANKNTRQEKSLDGKIGLLIDRNNKLDHHDRGELVSKRQ